MIVEFKEVRNLLDEPIKERFMKGEDLDKTEWGLAEAKVSAQFKRFVPCFSRELLDLKDKKTAEWLCKDLLLYWAYFFNYAYQNLTNEMNTEVFATIKQKYDVAVEFLEKNGTYYCSLLNEGEQTSPLQGTVRTFTVENIKFF